MFLFLYFFMSIYNSTSFNMYISISMPLCCSKYIGKESITILCKLSRVPPASEN